MKIPKRIRNHVNPLSQKQKINFNPFENDNGVIVDIGSYRGEFGQKLLDKFKEEKNFVFFEIRKPFYQYLKELFFENKNVKVFDGNAAENLKEILKKQKNIEYIFINFPDPWFKKKHHKRRVVNIDFLKDLEKFLDNHTKVVFQTDQKELFKETKKLIQDQKIFRIKTFKKPIWDISTYWEEMKIKEKKKIYRMYFWKSEKRKKKFLFF
ncbi:hypothetical protein CSB11_01360 [Candidatus Campbellbacteria bacterium]|nr:MAG: hypothetical protein CSB11_01360 [Candidatus Campbellbacteria bacterium]